MAGSNIVHQYFRKENEAGKILVKVNPIHLKAIMIEVPAEGEADTEEVEVSIDFEKNLLADGFTATSPIEFNLYWSGLI